MPPHSNYRLVLFLSLLLAALAPLTVSGSADGERLYLDRCAMCHQPAGTGVPPVYPPLAGSDWLAGHRQQSIKALCEGLSGPVEVKGQKYDNVMPAQVLDDEQAAAVLTYVGAAWGNKIRAVTAEEVVEVRKTSRFPTFALLTKASAFAPLPPAPKGWALRELTQLPEFCTRFAGSPSSGVLLLAEHGNVYRIDPASGGLELKIKASDYLEPDRHNPSTLGMAQDDSGRLWIVCNRQITETNPVTNEVTIYRTEPAADAAALSAPKVWLVVTLPFGVGPYNHGVSNMRFGPDGMLYVSSGSRTDGGEAGTDPHFYRGGEVEQTACIWRLDPKATEPKVEVFARGIRNAYGFGWDPAGRLFSVSNGPDANSPEEMDYVRQGRHYGFPFQFSDWPVEAGKPYPYTPKAPVGLEFTLPIQNMGPDGGGQSSRGLSTFDPHSSPGGIVWCGDDFPEPMRGGFLVPRFGNLLGPPAATRDIGFDVLFVKLSDAGQGIRAETHTVLAGLGRPLDVTRAGPATAWILEYTRPTNFKDQLGWLPGRVLELKPAP